MQPTFPAAAGANVPQVVEFDNYFFLFQMPIKSALQKELGTKAIPYNVAPGSPTFEFTSDGSSAQEQFIIKAEDMGRFVCNVSPAPIVIALPQYPGAMRVNHHFPGNPLLVCKSVQVGSMDGLRPADPYETDRGRVSANPTVRARWLETYGQLLVVTLNYEYDVFRLKAAQEFVDINDPESFTEHTTNVGGEFINIGQEGVRFLPPHKHRVPVDGGGLVEKPGGGVTPIKANPNEIQKICDPDLKLPFVHPNFDHAAVSNKDMTAPLSLVIANIEHTLTWPDVWDVPYCHIKHLLGKVNNKILPWLHDADIQTVLFIGAAITPQNNVANNGRRLYTVEYRFVERHIEVPGHEFKSLTDLEDKPQNPADNYYNPGETTYVLTWNHFFRPSTQQFEYLFLVKGVPTVKNPAFKEGGPEKDRFLKVGRPLYLPADLDKLFHRDLLTAPPDYLAQQQLFHNTERGIFPLKPHPCGYFGDGRRGEAVVGQGIPPNPGAVLDGGVLEF